MLKGIHLTLMVGPGVPIPVPRAATEALTDIQVTTSAGQRSGFQLTFALNVSSSLNTIFFLGPQTVALPPILRVVIVITINGTPEVIMDGVVTNMQVTPSNEPGQSTLTVTGEDLTAVMDLVEFDGFPFPALPYAGRVGVILAKYAALGITPRIIPSVLVDVPIPVKEIPRQKGTDLQYINMLAAEVGYVFYLTPGPSPGTSTAYWGPDIKVGVPQPALNLNMDAHTNVDSLNFSFDSESKKLPVVFIQNAETKLNIPIPIPDITPLNPPLGLIPPLPKGLDLIEHTSKYSIPRAAMVGLAKAAKSSDAVKASGSLDVLRYGRLLEARKLVGVRGVGTTFNGLYYVQSVTHAIKRGEYKQNFNLVRNGLVSTVPRVPA